MVNLNEKTIGLSVILYFCTFQMLRIDPLYG